MKALVASLVLIGSPVALAASEYPSFDEVIIDETAVIDVQIENSSGLSDSQLLAELAAVIESDDAFKGKVINLSVGTASDTLDFSMMKIQVETIGIKEKIDPSQFARDVGSVVSQAVGGVHGSASVKVKFSETNKKNPDGSSETSKNVEVSVTVSGGKK